MSRNSIDIQVKAIDNATGVLKQISSKLDNLESSVGKVSGGFSIAKGAIGGFLGNIATSLTGGILGIFTDAIGALGRELSMAVDAAVEMEKAIVTASVVFPRFNINAEQATNIAKQLGKELRIGTAPALDNLQKLVKSGLSLDKAADLLRRFTNEALTGKSANISLTQAVGNLVDMYYMEISALGNLSGISENVSVIMEKGLKVLQERGQYLGMTIGKLDEAARNEAKYAGFIDLTNQTLGSAEKFQGTYLDNLAKVDYQMNELRQTIGQLFLPVLSSLLDAFMKSGIIDTLRQKVQDFVDYMKTPEGKEAIQGLTNTLTKFLEKGKDLIETVLPDLLEEFKNFMNYIKSPEFKQAMETVKGFISILSGIGNIISGVANVINPISEISKTYYSLRPLTQWHTRSLPRGHALGTDFAPGGLALVGERGAELVSLPRGAKVFPANETSNIFNNQRSIVINNYVNSTVDVDRLNLQYRRLLMI